MEIQALISLCRKITVVLSLLGWILSFYAVYVESAGTLDPNYRALCDISQSISCSAVFGSEYGKGFGFLGKLFGNDSVLNQPNGVYGLIFYSFFFLICLIDVLFLAVLELILGISGVVMSIYLGYVLVYILEDACIVCISTYILNLLLFICAIVNYRAVVKRGRYVGPGIKITKYLGRSKKQV